MAVASPGLLTQGPQTKHVGERVDRRKHRVTGYRTRRLATVVSSALLGLLLLGTSGVAASTPGWEFINTDTQVPCVQVACVSLPTTVSPGSDVGYKFTIHNAGKSNISQLYLTTSVNAVPSYFFNSRGTTVTCQLSPTLFCAFGALNAGDTIDVLVAYPTPASGSSFSSTFQINGTGVSFTDPHKSHGDTLSLPFTTALSSSADFAGGFQISDATTYTDSGTLSKKNDQQSSASSSTLYIPVTIQDGLSSPPDGLPDPCGTLNCIGDWTSLHVGNGNQGPVKVTLILYGKSVPNGATVDNIGLWHGGPNPITAHCVYPVGATPTTPPTNIECVTVTLLPSGNFQIVAWLLHNGGLHGTY